MRESRTNSMGWRHYQRRLQRVALIKYYLRRVPWLGLYGGCSFLILAVLFYSSSWISAHLRQADQYSRKKGSWRGIFAKSLAREDLPTILRHMKLDQTLESESFRLTEDGTEFTVETSLDIGLQNYILGLLRRSRMYQAAVVALRPDNGQVLAMANYESHGGEGKENLCLRAGFPAASLFKIVSAAAAIEARGFTPDKSLYFKGKRHTLYKSQLLQRKGRYAVKTSFRRAFARSINPVFGKIGIYVLGRDLIADYADKFLFNHAIPFDLPLAVSRIHVPTDDFGMAEIASGFNRSTVMSPLHAALITSALANDGNMMEPWVTKRIRDESGRIVYRAKLSRLAIPIEEETAKSLMVLMEAAVVRGTCSKAFLSLRRKKAFKNIKLGAKTGTINDHSDQYKYDWLTAYAVPNHGKRGLCIAVLAVHGEKLGVRAKDLATRIINYHFTS